jgi:hypothetical protein
VGWPAGLASPLLQLPAWSRPDAPWPPAPQYKFTGTGTDLPLFTWLDTYTFPTEAGMRQLEEARQCYGKLVDRLLANGTTTAVS